MLNHHMSHIFQAFQAKHRPDIQQEATHGHRSITELPPTGQFEYDDSMGD